VRIRMAFIAGDMVHPPLQVRYPDPACSSIMIAPGVLPAAKAYSANSVTLLCPAHLRRHHADS
jgi:hypothetical protein